MSRGVVALAALLLGACQITPNFETGYRVQPASLRPLQGDLSRLITLYTSSAMVYGRAGACSFSVEPPPADAQVNPHSLFSWHFEALRRAMLAARPEIAAALTRYEASTSP